MTSFIVFGEMGAGKDTVAEMLAKNYNSDIVKLGKRIRNDVDEIYNKFNIDKNLRELYQHYGQSMRNVFGKDIWNLILYESIKEGLRKDNSYIIADARQPNEFIFWKELGFIPVGVVADLNIRTQRLKNRDGFDQSVAFNHETEVSARQVIEHIKELEPTREAFVITNNGTLDELEKEISKMIDIINLCQLVGSV